MDDWVLPPPRDLSALDRFDLQSLTGLTVQHARAQLEAVGGSLRAIGKDGAITLDFRPDRVTVQTDDKQARVVRVVGRF